MKISRIITIPTCGLAWALYGILAQTTLCTLPNCRDAVFFIFPSPGKTLLTLILAQIFAYSLWTGISFLKKRIYNFSNKDALQSAAISMYPGFFLFLLSGILTPYIKIFYKFSAFFLDLGPVFPCIILTSIIFKSIKPEFNFRKLTNYIDSVPVKKLGAALFISVLVIYAFFTLRIIHPGAPKENRYYLLTGDEPHYLLVTHSLVFDRDFNMHNNIVKGHSKIYFDRAVCGLSRQGSTFQKYARGKGVTATKEYWKGKRYSLCRLGLPLLLCPSYYSGYLWDHQIRLVVLLFLNLLTALLVWNVFHLTYYFISKKSTHTQISIKTAGLVSAIFFAFNMPVLFYSNRIFTEVAAALLLVYAFRKTVTGKAGVWISLSIGFCIAFLPWLHDKYIWFSVLLLIMFILRCRRTIKIPALLLFSAPIIISTLFLMRYYYMLFGVIYPVSMLPGFSWKVFTNASLGLILDENHGLYPYSPFYFFAIAGAVFMWKKNKNDTAWLIFLTVTFYIGIASFKEWWGGLCPPGRYLVPLTGLWIPFIAYAILDSRKARKPCYILGCLSIAMGFFSMWLPGRLYRHLHPFIHYYSWINLRGIFPNMISPERSDYMLLLAWFLVIALWAGWMSIRSKSTNQKSGLSIKPILLVFCTITIIVLFRKDSAIQKTNYDRLVLYQELACSTNKVIRASTSKPSYSIIKDMESIPAPFSITYEAEHLLYDRKNMVKDTGGRTVVRGIAGKTKEGFLLWGPYKKFPPGRYEVKITIRAGNIKNKSAPIAIFDAASSKGTIIHAYKEIYEKDLLSPGKHIEIVTPLEIKEEVSDIEFRMQYPGNANIYIDRIDITVK